MQWKYVIFLATEYCRRVVYNLGVTLVGRDGVKLSTVVSEASRYRMCLVLLMVCEIRGAWG